MGKRQAMRTADGVYVEIASVYLTETTATILQGGLDFVWTQCVDKAPERIRRYWSGPPVLMLPPVGYDRRKDQPPRWRVNVYLKNWFPLEPYDPNVGVMEGSHLTLIFFRKVIFDRPLDEIIARAVKEVEWKKHAKDWAF